MPPDVVYATCGHNKHWHATVYPGKWTITDESGVAGWYHGVMTIGLNHYWSHVQTDLYPCYSSHPCLYLFGLLLSFLFFSIENSNLAFDLGAQCSLTNVNHKERVMH
ncbi:hypothetical protein FRACYDRAFT_248741 [Fragilariopsis cylindrus CCMP1102]|uniref:Uncharacterized protein n=1 Tax=Fragilariopsis cylindrus CCMP1102 TaxID=635003 RepID=A0A1E7ETZ5_9STRA|nr:hypothetical protein FRACYDRAFT_248741 [Fragilariopsis cylindrus CCMP1102]|eukprot:OEU09317.1 hypothetical protein FRACYDRAFT_248741 [Fragilariopsis cylindrus CCMP1102]